MLIYDEALIKNFAKNATVLSIYNTTNIPHKEQNFRPYAINITSSLEKRRKIGKVPDNINDQSLLSFYLQISFKHLVKRLRNIAESS